MAKDKKSGKDKRCYSHVLLTQESILIWVMTIGMMLLAFYCIYSGYTGSLPWLAAMVAFPWTAYGVSQAFYYRKAMAENTKDGIKYESVLMDAQKVAAQYQNAAALEFDFELDEDLSGTEEIIDLDKCQI